MYTATTGEPFEDKVKSELFDLEQDQKFVYALVSVASFFRHPLKKEDVIIASGNNVANTLDALGKLLVRHLLVETNEGQKWIKSRHRVIAEIVVNDLENHGLLRDVISGLLLLAATKASQNNDHYSRMLRTFVSHKLLNGLIGVEQARNLYASFEDILGNNAHYWLHRGSLELQNSSLILAQNFLSQAMGLTDNNAYIETEWAHLLFRRAIEKPSEQKSKVLVEQAEEILERIISVKGHVGAHAYHLYGSQGLAWVRRCDQSQANKRQYLKKLAETVKKGCGVFGNNRDLRQLKDDLEREYLLLPMD
jgi:hypothetical protein